MKITQLIRVTRRLGALAALLAASGVSAAGTNVLILYDSGTNTANAPYGWVGNLHAKQLVNLIGHFNLPCQIKPVEDYVACDLDQARATFYLGTLYANPLPAAFIDDVATTTSPVCWCKYNLWQASWLSPVFDTRYGISFASLDASGYSNISYKGESFLKNQSDPELGVVSINDKGRVETPALAWKTNGGTASSIPYVTHSSNLWYVADSPFDYLTEEDRYVAFADLLHDILGEDHPESHHAIIRLEDVAMRVYPTNMLRGLVDTLRSLEVPFGLAFIPVYADPLGTYNGGMSETHQIADPVDPLAPGFRDVLRYAVTNGGQLLIHGYTHQYATTRNPDSGVTAEDYEFWRVVTTNGGMVISYEPVAEDSAAWALGRVTAATNQLFQAGLPWVGWESPHYAASTVDYQVFAAQFPLTMQRLLCFADDFTPSNRHVTGQFFPYVIQRDIYGQRVIPENLGYFSPTPSGPYDGRPVADIIRAARKNLVVRDGWANVFYHGYYGSTNLQDIVEGIRSLGYVYVPIAPSGPPVITWQPRSQTVLAGAARVKFSAGAIGSEPLHYQWQRNDTNLPQATNAILSFASVAAKDIGMYRVVVTNSFGASNSIAAGLYVLATPPTAAIQASADPARCQISFSTLDGPTYLLEYKDNLADRTGWLTLSNWTGNGATMTAELSSTNSGSRFFRLRVQ